MYDMSDEENDNDDDDDDDDERDTMSNESEKDPHEDENIEDMATSNDISVKRSPKSKNVEAEKEMELSKKLPSMVAVKVVKNRPAYTNQAKVEIKILSKLTDDPRSKDVIIHLLDHFTYHRHVFMVFELMGVNLFELIKRRHFRGLTMSQISTVCKQVLTGLQILESHKIVHCDLKPENILIQNFSDDMHVKIVDFGSACYEESSVYTYIQSRFYRAPEVILGMKYGKPIDLWSLGCIAVELFLGLPVFPGCSNHNQLLRIQEMLGEVPQKMLNEGKQTPKFYYKTKVLAPIGRRAIFSTNREEITKEMVYGSSSFSPGFSSNSSTESSSSSSSSVATNISETYKRHNGTHKQEKDSSQGIEVSKTQYFVKWVIKTPEMWAQTARLRVSEPMKRYFKQKSLSEIVFSCEDKRRPEEETCNKTDQDFLNSFLGFISNLLRIDPVKRMSASEALESSFIQMGDEEATRKEKIRQEEDFQELLQIAKRSSENVPLSPLFLPHSMINLTDSPPQRKRTTSISTSPPQRPLHPFPLNELPSHTLLFGGTSYSNTSGNISSQQDQTILASQARRLDRSESLQGQMTSSLHDPSKIDQYEKSHSFLGTTTRQFSDANTPRPTDLGDNSVYNTAGNPSYSLDSNFQQPSSLPTSVPSFLLSSPGGKYSSSNATPSPSKGNNSVLGSLGSYRHLNLQKYQQQAQQRQRFSSISSISTSPLDLDLTALNPNNKTSDLMKQDEIHADNGIPTTISSLHHAYSMNAAAFSQSLQGSTWNPNMPIFVAPDPRSYQSGDEFYKSYERHASDVGTPLNQCSMYSLGSRMSSFGTPQHDISYFLTRSAFQPFRMISRRSSSDDEPTAQSNSKPSYQTYSFGGENSPRHRKRFESIASSSSSSSTSSSSARLRMLPTISDNNVNTYSNRDPDRDRELIEIVESNIDEDEDDFDDDDDDDDDNDDHNN